MLEVGSLQGSASRKGKFVDPTDVAHDPNCKPETATSSRLLSLLRRRRDNSKDYQHYIAFAYRHCNPRCHAHRTGTADKPYSARVRGPQHQGRSPFSPARRPAACSPGSHHLHVPPRRNPVSNAPFTTFASLLHPVTAPLSSHSPPTPPRSHPPTSPA